MRVEGAVDKFLYWDEEVTLIEAVNAETVSGCGFVYDAMLPHLTRHPLTPSPYHHPHRPLFLTSPPRQALPQMIPCMMTRASPPRVNRVQVM